MTTIHNTSPIALTQQLRELVGLYMGLQRRYLHDQGLAPNVRLLITLLKLGPITQSELGRSAGLEKSWISRVVDGFVADGLVIRAAKESDRRCVLLNLTPAGLVRAREINDLMASYAGTLLSGIPTEQHAALTNALHTLSEALRPLTSEGGR
jgi:DNA-binding MarR family transcriptional regulator